MIHYIKTKLIEGRQDNHEHLADCLKLDNAIVAYYGVRLSMDDIRELWEAVSDDQCARWLRVPDDNEEIIDEYLEPFVG